VTPTNPLRDLLGGGPAPPVAVSFTDDIGPGDVELARRAGVDVAELRVDRFGSFATDHVVMQVRLFDRFPTLATVRSAAEGGDWTGSEREREEMFHTLLPHVDGVDVELASAETLATVIDGTRRQDKVLIVSMHDFEATPRRRDLDAVVERAGQLGADVVKVATTVRSTSDLRELARFTLDHAERGVIVIAMGDHGSASRVFFPALGSRLTFAATTHPVPGQLTYRRTFEMLRSFYPEYAAAKAHVDVGAIGLLAVE